MNPKEKAKYLVDKMKQNLYSDGMFDAKQCALIAVDELILQVGVICISDLEEMEMKYWNKVKTEINLL